MKKSVCLCVCLSQKTLTWLLISQLSYLLNQLEYYFSRYTCYNHISVTIELYLFLYLQISCGLISCFLSFSLLFFYFLSFSLFLSYFLTFPFFLLLFSFILFVSLLFSYIPFFPSLIFFRYLCPSNFLSFFLLSFSCSLSCFIPFSVSLMI